MVTPSAKAAPPQPDLTPSLPPQLPWPPLLCPTASQICLTLFSLPLSKPVLQTVWDLYQPCSFTLHKDNDWPRLHLDIILILHILDASQHQEFPIGHLPLQAPTYSFVSPNLQISTPWSLLLPREAHLLQSREFSLSRHRDSLPYFCGKNSLCAGLNPSAGHRAGKGFSFSCSSSILRTPLHGFLCKWRDKYLELIFFLIQITPYISTPRRSVISLKMYQ